MNHKRSNIYNYTLQPFYLNQVKMRRSDSIWLTLRAGLKDVLLQEHHRAYTALDFPSIDEQSPQLIALIGQQIKTAVMKKLRFGSHSQEAAPGEIHLRRDDVSTAHECPRIFAECELHNSPIISQTASDRLSGDIVTRPLTWHQSGSQTVDPLILAHMLYAKLLAPFSNVICFFSDDFGGLSAVAQVLALWLLSLSNRPSDLPPTAHPRVLILTPDGGGGRFDEQAATKRFMRNVGRESEKRMGMLTGKSKLRKAELDQLLSAQFGDMRVINLPSPGASSRSWRSFKDRILKDSDELQIRRQNASVAFSVRHFKALFHLACDHFSSDIVSPFSFIGAARIPSPVPMELPFHLMAFIKRVDRAQMMNFAVPVIASALMFESYPQGMHRNNGPPLEILTQVN